MEAPDDPRVSYTVKELLLILDDKLDVQAGRVNDLERRVSQAEKKVYGMGVVGSILMVILGGLVSHGTLALGVILSYL